MFTAILGTWSIVELLIIIPGLLLLAMTTHLDRQHVNNPRWGIPFIGVAAYWVIYMVTAGPGEWVPPLMTKAFWFNAATWWGIGKYLGIGAVYAVVELLSGIIVEKNEIRARWNALLIADDRLRSYVSSRPSDDTTELEKTVKRFCSNWGSSYTFVMLRVHELERVPQPYINSDRILSKLSDWILLWPGYLLSLLFGRILDAVIFRIRRIYYYIGNTTVRVLFRNTFSAN